MLMEHLPPVGWADVATKRDLEHLGTTIRLEIRGELNRELRLQTLSLIGAMTALNGITAGLLIALLG